MPDIVADLNKLKKKSTLAELAQNRPKLSYGPPSSGNGAPEGQPASKPEPPPLETVGAHPETVANTPRPGGLPPGQTGRVPLAINLSAPSPVNGPTAKPMPVPMAPAKPTLSYDQMRPQLEAEPERPVFTPGQGGIGRRLLAGLAQMGMMARGGGDPTARGFQAIGGLIGGMVNPEQVERARFEAGPMQSWQEMVNAVRAKNKAKMSEFAADVDARKDVAELNEIGQPKMQPLPGAAVGTLYDPRTGQAQQPTGANGMPIPMASVLNNELDETTRRDLARLKAENDVAKQGALFEQQLRMQKEKEAAQMALKLKDLEAKLQVLERAEKGRDKRAGMAEGGRNRRFSQGEAGKNARQDKSLKAKEQLMNKLRAPGGKLNVSEDDN